jgi:hypothetical protein
MIDANFMILISFWFGFRRYCGKALKSPSGGKFGRTPNKIAGHQSELSQHRQSVSSTQAVQRAGGRV